MALLGAMRCSAPRVHHLFESSQSLRQGLATSLFRNKETGSDGLSACQRPTVASAETSVAQSIGVNRI